MNKKPIYIIEHLEPELFEWCLIEYEHISGLVGKENIWFANIKAEEDRKKLEQLGRVFSESAKKLDLNWARVCVLDPEAEKTLKPEDSGKFDYYIFGGILGDHPPKKRTKKELTKLVPAGCEARNIGKKQMSTDNAVYTTVQIAEKQKKFDELKFKDEISIDINDVESVELPYRYNLITKDGKEEVFMSPKIIEYLKKKQGF